MPTYPTAEAGYVASVQEVADGFNVEEADLTAIQRRRILTQLAGSQGKVELALDRPILPVRVTKTGLTPVGSDTTSWRAWPDVWDDDITVVSATLQSDGTYTVVVDVGIDGRVITEIRAFIVDDAVESLRQDPDAGLGTRAVQSVSAEGQSVSYSDSRGQRQSANPIRTAGTKPRLEDLQRKWKRPLFEVVALPAQAPWPVDGYYVPRGATDWWR